MSKRKQTTCIDFFLKVVDLSTKIHYFILFFKILLANLFLISKAIWSIICDNDTYIFSKTNIVIN